MLYRITSVIELAIMRISSITVNIPRKRQTIIKESVAAMWAG
jgi:hypothetical protein